MQNLCNDYHTPLESIYWSVCHLMCPSFSPSPSTGPRANEGHDDDRTLLPSQAWYQAKEFVVAEDNSLSSFPNHQTTRKGRRAGSQWMMLTREALMQSYINT